MADSRRPAKGTGRPGARGSTRPQRPGGQRRPAGAPAAAAPVVHRRRFTGRMAIVAVVVAVLVVSYASSMRAYLQQRAHIADLRAQIAASSGDIGRLEREKRRWDDDAYVAEQARQRLGWVYVGETGYQVIGRDGKPLESRDRLTDPGDVVRAKPRAWWQDQYDALRAADHPPTKRKVPPAASIPSDAQ